MGRSRRRPRSAASSCGSGQTARSSALVQTAAAPLLASTKCPAATGALTAALTSTASLPSSHHFPQLRLGGQERGGAVAVGEEVRLPLPHPVRREDTTPLTERFPLLCSAFLGKKQSRSAAAEEAMAEGDDAAAVRRRTMVTDYRNKLLNCREVETRVRTARDNLKKAKKDYDKTEDDLKSLQSVGQIIGEVLQPLVQNKRLLMSNNSKEKQRSACF